jgi:hypothetical protein
VAVRRGVRGSSRGGQQLDLFLPREELRAQGEQLTEDKLEGRNFSLGGSRHFEECVER